MTSPCIVTHIIASAGTTRWCISLLALRPVPGHLLVAAPTICDANLPATLFAVAHIPATGSHAALQQQPSPAPATSSCSSRPHCLSAALYQPQGPKAAQQTHARQPNGWPVGCSICGAAAAGAGSSSSSGQACTIRAAGCQLPGWRRCRHGEGLQGGML